MTRLERIESAISKTGAELHHRPLNGLKAVTIRVSGKTAVYADADEFRGVCELQSAEAHEFGHVATGSFYGTDADGLTILRQELKADRYAAHRFLPVRKIKKAIADGNTELWQLSEVLEFDERFISRAIYIYKLEGKM